MLEYGRIGKLEQIDVNKTNESKECDVFHYWYCLNKRYRFETDVCNGCYDLMQNSTRFKDVAIVSITRDEWRIYLDIWAKMIP